MSQCPQKYCTERPQGKSRVKQLLRRGARISTQVQQGYDPQTIHYSLAGPSEVFGTTVLRNTGKDLVYGCTHLWWEQVPWVGVLAKAGKERFQNHRWPLDPLSLVIWRYSICEYPSTWSLFPTLTHSTFSPRQVRAADRYATRMALRHSNAMPRTGLSTFPPVLLSCPVPLPNEWHCRLLGFQVQTPHHV